MATAAGEIHFQKTTGSASFAEKVGWGGMAEY